MEEIGGGTQSWENHGKPLEESQVVFFRAFPREEIILGVLEMPGTPQKRKWSANHQSSPETGKN